MSLYEVLGVARSASESVIRAAYLKKAKRTHPDQGGKAEEFKEVARAYGVLGSAAKRLAYDETGREDEGPAVEDAAVAIVRNLTEMVIGNGHDPATTDFLREMRGQIAQAIANSEQQRADTNRKIARCNMLSKRFKDKSGNNLIAKILQGRMDEMERQVSAIERDRVNLEAAKTLLASYEYKVEPPKVYASQNAFNAMGLGSSSWMNQ
jgi:curved DNA-binding protein CbpA